MKKAVDFLRRLRSKRQEKPVTDAAFEARLQKMNRVRHVSVARAVLFRTRSGHPEA